MIKDLFSLPVLQGGGEGEDPSNHAPSTEDEKQEFQAQNTFYSNVTDEVMKDLASEGLTDEKGNFNIIPGAKVSKKQLQVLKAVGKKSYNDRKAIYDMAKQSLDAKMKGTSGGSEKAKADIKRALLGQIYKSLFSETPEGTEDAEPTGALLNQLLDIDIDTSQTVRQVRTNCVWFTPEDLEKKAGKRTQQMFEPIVMKTLGQHVAGEAKSDGDLVAETLRIASVPCANDPERILCFDSEAMVAYMESVMDSRGLKGTMDEAVRRGDFKDRIPSPRDSQGCVGGRTLSDDQLLMILRHYSCGRALKAILPTLSSKDIRTLLGMKDELQTIPPRETTFGTIWHSLTITGRKAVNNLPSILKSILALSLVRWIVCGFTRMIYVWTMIEKSGASALKNALKVTIKPMIKSYLDRAKQDIKNNSRSGKKANIASNLEKLTGINIDHSAVDKAIEGANDSTDANLDKAIDSVVEVLLSGLKGDMYSVLCQVVVSLKANFFGTLLTQFFDFCAGFMKDPTVGWTMISNFVAEGFSSVSSWMGLSIVGDAAKAGNFLVLLRGYLNPSLTRVETAQMASDALGTAASFFPYGQYIAAPLTAFRCFMESAKGAAILLDAKRIYMPTLQYMSAQLSSFLHTNWADIDVGSVSFLMVQFLPRCCGLLSLTSSVLLFDVTSLAPTWVTKAIPADVSKGFSTLVRPFTSAVSVASGILPFQATVGAGLKVYTTSVGGKSLCDRFAETVGVYIDYAAAAVLIYQIILDLGAVAYMIRYKELPPLNGYTTSCLKLFSKDQAADVLAKSAPPSEAQKIAIATKVDEAFREDASVKLGAFEKEEDRILEENAKTILGRANQAVGVGVGASLGATGNVIDAGANLIGNAIGGIGSFIGKRFGFGGGASPLRRSPRLAAMRRKRHLQRSPSQKNNSPKRKRSPKQSPKTKKRKQT
jgi:hypothetical protein